MSPKNALPEYASCSRCGEFHRVALRAMSEGILCANCSDTEHQRYRCAICEQIAPFELHHVAGREYSRVVIVACLNCHLVLTRWQQERLRRLRRKHEDERVAFDAVFHGYNDLERLHRMRHPSSETVPKWDYYYDPR